MTMTRGGLTAALTAAVLGAAACSRPAAPAGADDALRRDLAAAETEVRLARPEFVRTQFVSPLELGREAEPEAPAAAPRGAPRTAPRATAPARAPSRAARPAAVTRVARAEPAAEAPVAAAPREAEAQVPNAPAPAEPVVAAPSRRPDAAPAPARRGRVWSTGDVIRNAPFPINP